VKLNILVIVGYWKSSVDTVLDESTTPITDQTITPITASLIVSKCFCIVSRKHALGHLQTQRI